MLQKYDPGNWKILREIRIRAAGVEPTSASLESRALFSSLLEALAVAAPDLMPPEWSAAVVKQVFDALDAYGLSIEVPEFGPAVAVFAVTSRMEHSCAPNSRRLMGESITSAFVDCVASTFERQADLRRRRGAGVFCKCARCCDPRELGTDFGTLRCAALRCAALRCTRNRETDDAVEEPRCTGWVLPVKTPEVDRSDWKCLTCAHPTFTLRTTSGSSWRACLASLPRLGDHNCRRLEQVGLMLQFSYIYLDSFIDFKDSGNLVLLYKRCGVQLVKIQHPQEFEEESSCRSFVFNCFLSPLVSR